MSIFHYTKLATLLEYILQSKTLKTNDLNGMNDPRESHAWSFGGINIPLETMFPDYYSDETHIDCLMKFGRIIKDRFQVICFSGANHKGWDNEMMWAHYAENQRGVCLEFDEEKLRKIITDTYPKTTWVLEDVNYVKRASQDPSIYWNERLSEEDNFQANLARIYRDVVLHKSTFWEKEDEKRLVFVNQKECLFIPIREALKAIHIGLGFPRVYLPAIHELTKDWNIKIYQMIYQNDQYERWGLRKTDVKWESYIDESEE